MWSGWDSALLLICAHTYPVVTICQAFIHFPYIYSSDYNGKWGKLRGMERLRDLLGVTLQITSKAGPQSPSP